MRIPSGKAESRACRAAPVLLLFLIESGCSLETEGEPHRAPVDPKIASLEERLAIRLGLDDSPVHLKEYWPLAEYLTPRTPFRFEVQFARQADAETLLETDVVDLVLLDAFSCLKVQRRIGARPLLSARDRSGEPVTRSIFVTARESTIEELSDLRDRSLGLGPPHSLLSSIVPRQELELSGVPLKSLKVEELPDEQQILDRVGAKSVDAGALPETLTARAVARSLRVFHISAPVPSATLVARGELPERILRPIITAFLSLSPDGAPRRSGWSQAVTYGFVPANPRDYESVRALIQRVGKSCGTNCHGAKRL